MLQTESCSAKSSSHSFQMTRMYLFDISSKPNLIWSGQFYFGSRVQNCVRGSKNCPCTHLFLNSRAYKWRHSLTLWNEKNILHCVFHFLFGFNPQCDQHMYEFVRTAHLSESSVQRFRMGLEMNLCVALTFSFEVVHIDREAEPFLLCKPASDRRSTPYLDKS